jgi:N-acetylmuramoyl-L-alanine amidase
MKSFKLKTMNVLKRLMNDHRIIIGVCMIFVFLFISLNPFLTEIVFAKVNFSVPLLSIDKNVKQERMNEQSIQMSMEQQKTDENKEVDEKNEKQLEEKEPLIEENKGKELSQKDKEALYRIVEAEATDEDIKGKILVANVIFNRVDSDQFPSTVYDVITQRINGRAQFSPLDDNRYYTVEVSEETIEAVERAIQGEDYSNDAMFFMAPSLASERGKRWFRTNLTKVYAYGIHEFYTY